VLKTIVQAVAAAAPQCCVNTTLCRNGALEQNKKNKKHTVEIMMG